MGTKKKLWLVANLDPRMNRMHVYVKQAQIYHLLQSSLIEHIGITSKVQVMRTTTSLLSNLIIHDSTGIEVHVSQTNCSV